LQGRDSSAPASPITQIDAGPEMFTRVWRPIY
jgi:hypothetical protein